MAISTTVTLGPFAMREKKIRDLCTSIPKPEHHGGGDNVGGESGLGCRWAWIGVINPTGTATASASASSPRTAFGHAQALGTPFWARWNCISKCPPCALGMHVSVFEAGQLLHPAPRTASPCAAGHWLPAAQSPLAWAAARAPWATAAA
ncbi:hypothetical protein COCHEDRAFT_1157815 [Bipolaris maydis C5]|uniref:Uncharacterized protein n=1 Tax=Cochliobolus heterostrophus (strain C5 / ATCC 48332 / race O) TaxID=701091 RepID=M2SUG6_COCH5|nr:hypothetical protein COCHEDRAFT_1157815 [Bipolaris maydis C5]